MENVSKLTEQCDGCGAMSATGYTADDVHLCSDCMESCLLSGKGFTWFVNVSPRAEADMRAEALNRLAANGNAHASMYDYTGGPATEADKGGGAIWRRRRETCAHCGRASCEHYDADTIPAEYLLPCGAKKSPR